MSDLRLYNTKLNKILKKQKIDKQSLKLLSLEHVYELFGLKLIKRDFSISGSSKDLSDLCYDENYQLVIIEFRSDKFSPIINKGLKTIDDITKNLGKVKVLINEAVGEEILKQLNLKARLISLGEDFNSYDENAINRLPYVIDLIKYQVYEKDLFLLEKIYQSKQIDDSERFLFNNEEEYKIYKNISDFILSLGDEVCEVHGKYYIAYRRISNFIYLMIENGISLRLKNGNTFKTINIKNYKTFEKYKSEIEKCYDES